MFLFECLSRGINTRLSMEWLHDNKSMSSYKKMKDTRIVWTEMYDKDEEIPSMEEIYQNKHNQDAIEPDICAESLGVMRNPSASL